MTMTQEEIKNLVGKKYFNAYKGETFVNANPQDLLNDVKVLEAVNALGYRVWQIEDLTEIEDVRLVPIILAMLNKYDNLKFEDDLISWGLSKPIYKDTVPTLIQRYKNIEMPRSVENNKDIWLNNEYQLRFRIGDTLYYIKCKDYIDDYLELITRDEYIVGCYQIISLLFKFKERRALEPSLRLLKENSRRHVSIILKNIACFNDPNLIEYVEPFLKDPDGDFRQMAKRAIERLSKGH